MTAAAREGRRRTRVRHKSQPRRDLRSVQATLCRQAHPNRAQTLPPTAPIETRTVSPGVNKSCGHSSRTAGERSESKPRLLQRETRAPLRTSAPSLSGCHVCGGGHPARKTMSSTRFCLWVTNGILRWHGIPSLAEPVYNFSASIDSPCSIQGRYSWPPARPRDGQKNPAAFPL